MDCQLPEMERIEELCWLLDSLEYNLCAVMARAKGIKNRITDEWIFKVKPKTYGRPPIVLSQPLTEEQVKSMLEGLTAHIESCRRQSSIILNTLGGKPNWSTVKE